MLAETNTEYVMEVAMLFPPQGQWTEYHFYLLPETNQKVELANGELIVSPSATPKHQLISLELTYQLSTFVRVQKSGIVLNAPLDVRLDEGKIRQPDVFFVLNENRDRVKEQRFEGTPDWIAEIISPGSRTTDEETKMAEYAKAGVPEYWLIDPEAETVRVYVLAGDAYDLRQTAARGETAGSVTIEGFILPVDALFRDASTFSR